MRDIQEVTQEWNDGAQARQHKLDYHQTYNAKNKERLKELKRAKYASSPEYRAAAIQRAKERYDAQKKLRQEIRKSTGIQQGLARKRGHANVTYCPTCLQVIPKAPKPVFKSLQKKYLVAMYPVRELARRLGKQVQTIVKWINEAKMIPDTMYKEQRSGTAPARLWTQDQVEMYMRLFDQVDVRPPASYKTVGLTAQIRTEWDKLRPLGIDPKLYTIRDEQTGLLARESYDLPLPKFATASEQREHKLQKDKKNEDQKEKRIAS